VKANDDYVNKFQAVSNQQLLMNLARLADDEPASYIQIGTFSAAYTYGATLGTATPTYAGGFGGGKPATTTVNLGAALGLSYSEAPTFSFTPLSGDAVTKALFTPVPKNVFSLILSTWTTDCAIRTLVQSMKIVPPEPRERTSDEAVLFVPAIDTWTWDAKLSSYRVHNPAESEPPISYTATGLPPGLAIDASGNITGEPAMTGEWTATVSGSYNIIILPQTAKAVATAPAAVTGTRQGADPASSGEAPAAAPTTTAPTLSVNVTATRAAPGTKWCQGNTGYVDSSFSYTPKYYSKNPPIYAATGLPIGLSIDSSTGTVSGVPTTSGIGTVKISTLLRIAAQLHADSSELTSVSRSFPIPHPTIATRDSKYCFPLPFFNNLPEGSIISGLPPGLKLESGSISGTPTEAGTWIVSLGSDNAPATVFDLTVADPELPPPPLFASQPSDQSCKSNGRAVFTVGMATACVADQPPGDVNYQWEASADSGRTWAALVDGADRGDSSDPHNLVVYSGVKTGQLSVVRVTEKMNLRRFRCKVTEKETDPIVIKNDPKDQSYPLFLALTYEILCAQRDHVIPAPFTSDFEKKRQERAERESESKAITMGNIKLADAISAQSDSNNYTIEDSAPKADAAGDASARINHDYKVYKKPAPPDDTSLLPLPNPKFLNNEILLRWIQRRGERIEWSLRSFDTILYFIAQEDHRFGSMTDVFATPEMLKIKEAIRREAGDRKKKASVSFHDSLIIIAGKKPLVPEDKLLAASLTSMPKISDPGPGQPEKPTTIKALHCQFPKEIMPPNCELDVEVSSPSANGHGDLAELTLKCGDAPPETFWAKATLRLTNYHPDKELTLVALPYKLRGKTTNFVVGNTQEEIESTANNIIPSMPNTTEFTLLSYLFDQASIDSSKLPVQQLIEVR
jgi:hypothetical protein